MLVMATVIAGDGEAGNDCGGRIGDAHLTDNGGTESVADADDNSDSSEDALVPSDDKECNNSGDARVE